MQAAAQIRQFYTSVFLDYYHPGPPPPPPPPPTPSPVTVNTTLAIDPSLSNSITVLAYVLAFKFALEAFTTTLPFISASLCTRSHFMSASRRVAISLVFMFGIASLVVLLAPFTPAISTLAVFIMHGRDGGFSDDTRFLCPYHVDGSILHVSLSFSGALQFLRSHYPCMSEDGSTLVTPMSFLLSYDAPSMLGRISRLISFAIICTSDRLAQSNIMRCLHGLFQMRIELPLVFHSASDHFDLALLPVFVAAGLALYIAITLMVPVASCLMSGALHTVRVLVSKSVGSPRWRDGLVKFPTLAGQIFASCIIAIQCVWRSAIGRIIITTSTARKDDACDILLAKNCTLKNRLRSLSNRFNALKECVKDLRKMRAADQSNIRNLQHAADHALRQRDDVQTEANIATLKADALEVHIFELEATIKRLEEEAAGWTQLARDVLAINASVFAIQPADVTAAVTNAVGDEANVIAAQNSELKEIAQGQAEEVAKWAQYNKVIFAVDVFATALQATNPNVTAHETPAFVSRNSELEAVDNHLEEQMEDAMRWEQFNGDVLAFDMFAATIQSTDVLPSETKVDRDGDDALVTQNLELEKPVTREHRQMVEAAEWAQLEKDVFAVDTSVAATQLAEINAIVQEADALAHSVEFEANVTGPQEQTEEAAEWAQFERDVFAVDTSATATQPAETNAAAHEADTLAAKNPEPEEIVKCIDERTKKAAELAQLDTVAFACDMSATVTERPYVLPSISSPHIRNVVPSIIFTNAESETEALSTCRVTVASLGAVTLAGTNAKAGSASRLPRRALTDITTGVTKCSVKGTVKSQVKQTARKTQAEKENLRFGYRGA